MLPLVVFKIVQLLFLLAILYLLGRPIVRGAIYFPTSARSIEIMIKIVEIKSGQRLADLGSGDGRILIAFARQGAQAHGYEINPLLVLSSRHKIKQAGLQDRALVHWKNFWRADFSRFDIIIVFGISYIMKGLEKKLKKELKPGAKVISNLFQFPNWQPTCRENGVYLYIKD